MTDPADAPFDFYGKHYSRFGSGLAAAIRREIYGEDLGQTGWRTAAEQAKIVDHLRLHANSRLLDIACGAGGPSLDLVRRTGCHVTGLDIEPAGIAQAQDRAEALGLAARSRFQITDGGKRLPFRDNAFDAVLCVDAINHLPDRFGTLREWTRVLRPGGRLLFIDPIIVTGGISRDEVDERATLGFYLFVPLGLNEEAIATVGLTLLACQDATPAVADIAGRWHDARARHRQELQDEEGEAWFAQRQRFLATTAELAASRRLSRHLYLAEKPSGDRP